MQDQITPEPLHRGLKNRHIQLIALGGAIGIAPRRRVGGETVERAVVRQQRRAARHAPLEGPHRKLIEEEDQPGGEPPEEQGVGDGQCIGHRVRSPGGREADVGRQVVRLGRDQIEADHGGARRHCRPCLAQLRRHATLFLPFAVAVIDLPQFLEAGKEGRVVDVELQRKHLAGDFRGDLEDFVAIFGGVNVQCLMEVWPLVVQWLKDPLTPLLGAPAEALSVQVALAQTDLLAMLPKQWMSFAMTRDVLDVIAVREALPAPDIVLVRRLDLPLSPPSEFFCDVLLRSLSRDCV